MREPIKFFRFSAERHFSVVAWWWLSANDWNLELRKDYSKSDLETFDVNIALFQKRCSKANYDLWLNFPKKEGLSAEHSVLITPVCRLCFHVFLLSKEENFEKSWNIKFLFLKRATHWSLYPHFKDLTFCVCYDRRCSTLIPVHNVLPI